MIYLEMLTLNPKSQTSNTKLNTLYPKLIKLEHSSYNLYRRVSKGQPRPWWIWHYTYEW